MCDRILVFSSNPGRVASEIAVTLPHPRNRLDPVFRQLVDDIYALMTQRPEPQARRAGPPAGCEHRPAAATRRHQPDGGHDRGDRRRRPTTAAPTCRRSPPRCNTRSTSCCRWARRCNCCSFAELEEGDIKLTPIGQSFVDVRHRPAQEAVRRPAARARAARRAHQAGAGRAPEPPRAGRRASARSSRTTCPRTTPRNAARGRSPGPLRRAVQLRRERQTFCYENPQ